MAKDIEKLIEEFVIPEMEYSPSYEKKSKSKKGKVKTVTIDEIPEVVLPKTKAEVYEEAKGRLKQKTSAVSRRVKKGDSEAQPEVAATTFTKTVTRTVTLEKPVRTVTLEKPVRTVTLDKLRMPVASPAASPVAEPTWVGGADELVPFAWRMPLIPDIARPSKYYRQAVREARELLLPVPQNK
ncbi:MAG: hypothetical protein K2L88_06935 [Clostridiales bacterium]|nr:hypothetical protein [Clostridiales bacterium]